MPETMTDPRALFEHELGDIMYAERTIETMLPKLVNEASDRRLAAALQGHLDETRRQIERLQQVFKAIGSEPKAERCPGIEGLKSEHDHFLREEQPSQDVLDMFLTGATARVEHYEIAAYTGLVAAAQGLGEKKAADLLQQTLQEEKAMLRRAERAGKRLAGASGSSRGKSGRAASGSR